MMNEGYRSCPNYPRRMFIPAAHDSVEHDGSAHHSQDTGKRQQKVSELVQNARLARVRQRFPVPVVAMLESDSEQGSPRIKYLLRSGTTSRPVEVWVSKLQEMGRRMLFGTNGAPVTNAKPVQSPPSDSPEVPTQEGPRSVQRAQTVSAQFFTNHHEKKSTDLDAMDETDTNIKLERSKTTNTTTLLTTDSETNPVPASQDSMTLHKNADISLLKEFRVNAIVDLMVEYRKVKYGLTVSSSEKIEEMEDVDLDFEMGESVEKGEDGNTTSTSRSQSPRRSPTQEGKKGGKYKRSGIALIGMPYPGVEFFRDVPVRQLHQATVYDSNERRKFMVKFARRDPLHICRSLGV